MVKKFAPLRQLTLLYAEDDREFSESLMRIFNCYFGAVHVAYDGQEALDLFQSKGADIAILDIRMPKINGLEVAQQIRQSDAKMPIFIMSSYHEHQDLIASIKLGVVDYILKPFELEALYAALEKSLAILQDNHRLVDKLGQNTLYDNLSKTLYIDNEALKLSKSERIVLELLLENRGKIVTYEMIEEALLDVAEASRGSIKNLILKLRRKIAQQTIENVQYVGYVLR